MAIEQAAAGFAKGTIEAPFGAAKEIAEIAEKAVDTYIKWQQEKREGQKFNMAMDEKFGTVVNLLPEEMDNLPGVRNFPKLSPFGEEMDCPPPFVKEANVKVETVYFYHTRVKAVRSIASLVEKREGPYSTKKREAAYATEIQQKGAQVDPDLMKGLTNLAVYQPLVFNFQRWMLDINVFKRTRDNIKAAIDADRVRAKRAWGMGLVKLHQDIRAEASREVDKYFERLEKLSRSTGSGGWTQWEPKARKEFLDQHSDLLGRAYVEKLMKLADEAADAQFNKEPVKDDAGRIIMRQVDLRIAHRGKVYESDPKTKKKWVDMKEDKDIFDSLPKELDRVFSQAKKDVDAWYNDIVNEYGQKRYINKFKITLANAHLGRERKCTPTARHQLEGEVVPEGGNMQCHLHFAVLSRKGKEAATVARGGDFVLDPHGAITKATGNIGKRFAEFAIVS